MSTDVASDKDVPEDMEVNFGEDNNVSSVMIYSSRLLSIRLPLKVKKTGDFEVKVAFRNCVVATHKQTKAAIIIKPITI